MVQFPNDIDSVNTLKEKHKDENLELNALHVSRTCHFRVGRFPNGNRKNEVYKRYIKRNT